MCEVSVEYHAKAVQKNISREEFRFRQQGADVVRNLENAGIFLATPSAAISSVRYVST